MRATRRGRPDSAARLRALTRRAYTATAGHLDLEANPERDEDAAREFDRIVSGGPPDPAHSRRDHRAQAARRWAVSGRAVVAVLAVLTAVTGAVVARAIASGPSDAVPVPQLRAAHGAPRGDDGSRDDPAGAPRTAAGGQGSGAPEEGGDGSGTASPQPGDGLSDPAATHAAPEPPAAQHAGVVVHVAGAVERPGVVELPAGSRVAAAVDAAGGALGDAELSAVNLARLVVDGEQVYVPRAGEALPGAAPPGPPTPAGTPAGSGDPPGVVDLNTADLATLDTLPGVGPAIAQRILDWREAHGPFHSVDELLEVSGIGPATLERLRDRVRV